MSCAIHRCVVYRERGDLRVLVDVGDDHRGHGTIARLPIGRMVSWIGILSDLRVVNSILRRHHGVAEDIRIHRHITLP